LFTSAMAQSRAAPAKEKSSAAEAASMNLQLEIIKTEVETKLYALSPDDHKDLNQSSSKLAELYKQAALDAATTQYLLGAAMSDYHGGRERAQSAPQVSQIANETATRVGFLIAAQNSALIEQNKKIIELLERIAKKP
jgi:hypothetical protein